MFTDTRAAVNLVDPTKYCAAWSVGLVNLPVWVCTQLDVTEQQAAEAAAVVQQKERAACALALLCAVLV